MYFITNKQIHYGKQFIFEHNIKQWWIYFISLIIISNIFNGSSTPKITDKEICSN
jgi:hypothetical protein